MTTKERQRILYCIINHMQKQGYIDLAEVMSAIISQKELEDMADEERLKTIVTALNLTELAATLEEKKMVVENWKWS